MSCVTAPDGDRRIYIRDNGIGIGEPRRACRTLWMSEYNACERAGAAAARFNFRNPPAAARWSVSVFRSLNKEESVNVRTANRRKARCQAFRRWRKIML